MTIHERALAATCCIPLSISSTRRSGQNGLCNANEIVAAYLRAFLNDAELVGMIEKAIFNQELRSDILTTYKDFTKAALDTIKKEAGI